MTFQPLISDREAALKYLRDVVEYGKKRGNTPTRIKFRLERLIGKPLTSDQFASLYDGNLSSSRVTSTAAKVTDEFSSLLEKNSPTRQLADDLLTGSSKLRRLPAPRHWFTRFLDSLKDHLKFSNKLPVQQISLLGGVGGLILDTLFSSESSVVGKTLNLLGNALSIAAFFNPAFIIPAMAYFGMRAAQHLFFKDGLGNKITGLCYLAGALPVWGIAKSIFGAMKAGTVKGLGTTIKTATAEFYGGADSIAAFKALPKTKAFQTVTDHIDSGAVKTFGYGRSVIERSKLTPIAQPA